MKSIPLYIKNKNNPDKVQYKHPLLKDILSETYGCIIYQEQVMEICRKLAGYSYGHADIVRRAMAKKKHDVMLRERESFVKGAEENGVSADVANSIFDEMISFASYAFNKSHATAYACLSYQTAYLKYHYRGIYISALMSSVMSSAGKLAEYINMCRLYGTEIVRPDVNRSLKGFSYRDGKMYFGLLAVKNVGAGLADRIIAERQLKGRFTGLQNFCERMDGHELSKKSLESMIMAGAFDGLGLNRRQMLENYEMILEASNSDNNGIIDGQLNFLDSTDTQDMNIKIPSVPEYSRKKLLSMEKETAGIYLSGNPLSEYEYISELLKTRKLNSVSEVKDGDSIKFLCLIQSKKNHVTKKGDKMCFLTLADETGEIDAVVFPELYNACSSYLKEDGIVFVNGRISVKDESISVICSSVINEQDFSRMTAGMKLCIKISSPELSRNHKLLDIYGKFSGSTPVVFYLTDMRKMVSPKQKISLDISSESYLRLKEIYPPSCIGLIQ